MNLGVSATYQNADQALLDAQLDQVYYRQLATVSLHIGITRIIAAAQWLSENGRLGTISWYIPGRLALWSGVAVAPALNGTPSMSVWIYGGALLQRNTVLTRKGFWALGFGPTLSP